MQPCQAGGRLGGRSAGRSCWQLPQDPACSPSADQPGATFSRAYLPGNDHQAGISQEPSGRVGVLHIWMLSWPERCLLPVRDCIMARCYGQAAPLFRPATGKRRYLGRSEPRLAWPRQSQRHQQHRRSARPLALTRWIWLTRWIQATLGYQIHRISRIHRAIDRRRHPRNRRRIMVPASTATPRAIIAERNRPADGARGSG